MVTPLGSIRHVRLTVRCPGDHFLNQFSCPVWCDKCAALSVPPILASRYTITHQMFDEAPERSLEVVQLGHIVTALTGVNQFIESARKGTPAQRQAADRAECARRDLGQASRLVSDGQSV